MSKKDYIAIAKVFAESVKRHDCVETRAALADIAGDLCPVFKRDNPNFDQQRFLDACFPE